MTDLAERRGLDEDVYQPAEDTRLLATAAVEHVDADDLVLDVGTGSGFVAATVAEETDARVVGTDLNPHACRQARERGVEAVRADLLDPIADDALDVVTCNPPYLPDEPVEVGGAASGTDDEDGNGAGGVERASDEGAADAEPDWMRVALSGGDSGREVIEPLLDDVGRVLREDGYVVLLVSSLTGVDEVVELASGAGFSAVALAEDSFPYETLTVLKLVQ